MTDDKIEYLKAIYDEENDRQKIVEGKLGQIIANSGIFLSLIGLLITMLYNTQDVMGIAFKIVLFAVITAIIVLYIISMISALKGIDPLKYNYARANPDTIDQFSDLKSFKEQLVTDYRTCIDTNHDLNSTKLEFLANARRAFVAGIYITGFLTLSLMAYLSFFYIKAPSQTQKIEVVSPSYQNNLSSINKSLITISKSLKDSNKNQKPLHRH